MNEKLELLEFGVGAAQQEDNLRAYFFKSGAYQSAISPAIFLVLGAKGAGKSAIFQSLKQDAANIASFKKPNAAIVDEPFIVKDLAPVIAEISDSRANLWKLYFASLAAEVVVGNQEFPEELRKMCQRFLARWGLVREVPTKWQTFKKMKVDLAWGGIVKAEFPPKTKLAVGEIDAVLFSVSDYFASQNGNLWLCLDSLDEVVLDGPAQASTEDILGDCMRAVGEIIRLKGIKFKLFFRTDIYNRLTYVNKDHFSSSKEELKWSRDDLAILLAHRLAKVSPKQEGPVTVAIANLWINGVFEWGGSVPSFDDLYSKLQDGLGNVQPRDLVHFCIKAQRHQGAYNIQGTNKAPDTKLIGVRAIDEALTETANAKLTDFLNVFKTYSATIEQLRGHPKATLTRPELETALGKAPIDAALIIADLWQVGVLRVMDKKSINQSQSFEFPYLYAKALNLGI